MAFRATQYTAMTKSKHGIHIFDRTGAPLLEVGAHLVWDTPEFAEKIGAIAASWAQAEVNLYCLFAVLLDTTPDEAERMIKKHRTAAAATVETRRLAEELLRGAQRETFLKILDQLDVVRQRRNRVQHDVWAKVRNNDKTLFAVHANEYLAFTNRLVAVIKQPLSTNDDKAEQLIALADEFAESVSQGFTVEDMRAIHQEVSDVSLALQQEMITRIALS